MHRNTLTWSVLVLAAASSMWACGSEDDSSDNPGGGGTSAGTGGTNHAGSGGAHAGSGGAHAGTSGKAGGNNSGAGESFGGQAGDGAGGQAGAPEIAGAGGDAPGFAGSGGDSGAAGAAGSSGGHTPTLAENCATVCADQATLSCTLGTACVPSCTGIADPTAGTEFPEEYAAMIACQAQHMDPADYTCSVQGPTTAPAPKVGVSTPCRTEICKWTCDDLTLVDANVATACGCG